MKTMKTLFSILTLLLVSSLSAQSYQISGLITDKDNAGLDLALISLYKQSDSTFIKSEFTDEDGSYLISGIIPDKYLMKVKQLGFLDYNMTIEIDQNKTLPSIQLTIDPQMLNQVTVKSETPFVVRKIDRTVITPDALIANAGSNALEVLERAPGLSVDQNGAIILKGRSGVAVFINDKPSYLSGTELENYLRTLPAGSIKNIEVMENPPAKYEAAGNAGIVNINLKRGTVKGVYGNASVSYRKSRYNSSNNSLNLNYGRQKLIVRSNIYGGLWENFQDLNINRYYLDTDNVLQSSFAQNSFNNRKGKYLNGRVGVDFYPTEKLTIGFGYKSSTSPVERNTDNTALVSDANGQLLQKVLADNISNTSFRNNLVNMYISKVLDSSGTTLSLDADYVRYQSGNDQVFKNYQYNNENLLIYEDQINGEIPSEINIYAIKADFIKPLKSASRFESGVKSAFTQTDNEAIYTNTVGGVTSPDYNLSNRFLYDEWINAAYVNYSTAIGKIGLQFGLRGEATRLEGNQLGNQQQPDTSFTRSYAALFPTFYASRQLDSLGKHGLNLSYGRRIDRPYFQDLNPFVSPLDKFTFYTGNPNLLPTYAHNASLTYSYNNKLNISLSYSKTVDGIMETLEIQDEIYYSRPGNIASSQFISLSADGTLPITNWYSINAYAQGALAMFDSDLYDQKLRSRGINVYLSATNTFRLKKGWKIDVSGRYMNDQVSSQLVIKGYAILNFGLQKNVMDGKGNIKVSVNDLLYSQIGSGIINNLSMTDADWNSKLDSRSVTAAFSYRFGKSTTNKRGRNGTGSDSEQRRVKG